MKKISFIALLFVAFVCLNSCEENIPNEYGIPSKDTTMLWPVQTDTSALWGYINERGEMVIPPTYLYAYGFSCGKAKVYLQDHRVAFIDKTGKIIHIIDEGCDNYFYYDCLICNTSYKMRTRTLLDTNFKEILPKVTYYYVGPMTKDGFAATDRGFYTKSGRCAIRKVGDSFCDGVAVISNTKNTIVDLALGTLNTNYGAINTKGKIVIDTIYNLLFSVGNNRLLYAKWKIDGENQWGLMDTQGNLITEISDSYYPPYNSFYGDGGLMPIKLRDGGWGYMDENGIVQITCEYDYVAPFCEGVAWVENYEDTYYLIDLQGNILISLQPRDQFPCGTFHNGLCLICERNSNNGYDTYQYINKQGEVIYSWTPYRGENNTPELQKPAKLSENEMLLKHFEGTEYYPLAEQCAKRMRERENIKNN